MPVEVCRWSSPAAQAREIAATIFTRHRHGLLSIARRNSDSTDAAEEALQDALTLFIEKYDPTSGTPALPWLVLTLKRRCWAITNRARLEKRLLREADSERDRYPSAEALARPEMVVEAQELARIRCQHLCELKRDERHALVLKGLGYSYKEICERTGWTYTKVNRCIRNGRAALR